ncbi:AraC family transcriptional regulator [Paenibacillus sp. NPDC056579]|uniref:AraC family transcriptional regulator n=1 Tax=unclassified Paenibacillus TaxID=185978 RepID=UPI001EF7927B|nr:AraC family transcriptional regulator [Paenibacillus sp. H1-7]ULL18578.1 AraC family transcriptional regulator [Paenibacillus sp. H1-7]
MIRHGNIYMTITDFEQKLPVYLDCIGKWRNQYPIERPEGYPNYQWIQCTRGQGVLELNGTKQYIGQGQGMLLFPDEPHAYCATMEPWEVNWLSFNGSYAGEMLRSLGFIGSRILTFANPDPILQHIYRLMSVAEATDPMKSLECSSLTYQLILDLYRYGAQIDIRSRQQFFEQLAPALRYIEDRYHSPITLEDLASRLSVTPQHTCTLFQLTLGTRPFEYVTKIRLRKAKELLMRHQELDIGEVARKVGYEHTSYFIKVFKREEGMTPGAFRKKS